jgi:hypothetical protein
MGGASNLLQSFTGYNQQLQGQNLQIATFRQAATRTNQVAAFNKSINRLNLNRSLAAQSRQTERNLSTYRALAPSKGFASTSQTAMAFMDAELSNFERSVQQQRVSNLHQEQAIDYQAAVRKYEFEAQAAQVQARRSRTRTAGIGNLITQVGQFGKLLGDL